MLLGKEEETDEESGDCEWRTGEGAAEEEENEEGPLI